MKFKAPTIATYTPTYTRHTRACTTTTTITGRPTITSAGATANLSTHRVNGKRWVRVITFCHYIDATQLPTGAWVLREDLRLGITMSCMQIGKNGRKLNNGCCELRLRQRKLTTQQVNQLRQFGQGECGSEEKPKCESINNRQLSHCYRFKMTS